MWFSTIRTDNVSRVAISRLDRPCPISITISRSRSVSGSRSAPCAELPSGRRIARPTLRPLPNNPTSTRVSPCAGRRGLRAPPHRPQRSNRPYLRILLTLTLIRHHLRHATLQRNGRQRRRGALQRSLQALAIEARRNAPRTA